MAGSTQIVKAFKILLQTLEPIHPGECLSWFVIVDNDTGWSSIANKSFDPLRIEAYVPGLSHKQDIRGAVFAVELLPRDSAKALIVNALSDRSTGYLI